MLSNVKVAQAFAEGKTIGYARNMFIDSDTIYSYGYHFPIARMTKQKDEDGKTIVLFTNRGYSNTTAKHKSHVYSALFRAGYRVIECDIKDGRVTENTIKYLQEQIDELHKKVLRARKEWNKKMHFDKATKLTQDVATLRSIYSI